MDFVGGVGVAGVGAEAVGVLPFAGLSSLTVCSAGVCGMGWGWGGGGTTSSRTAGVVTSSGCAIGAGGT